MYALYRSFAGQLHRCPDRPPAPLALLLIAIVLITSLPAAQLRPYLPGGNTWGELENASAPATPAARPTYLLPEQLVGKPELSERRSAASATFDMGDGSYAVFQSLEPLHYRADDGNWQPINPRFAAVEGGWINRENSVVTGLAQRSSTAKLAAGNAGVAWQPRRLVLRSAGGEQLIAETLPESEAAPGVRSPDGTLVRYQQSWSLDGLQDQWQARRGGSEYTLRLAERPAPAGLSEPQYLELVAQLNLLPGTRIMVGGEPAALPLTTGEAISFVAPNGDELLLDAPYLYEQNQRSHVVAADYLLQATDNEQIVELRLRAPWSWLAAAERQYPVIIDPHFMMREPTRFSTVNYRIAPDGSLELASLLPWPRVGRWGAGPNLPNGLMRLAARFDLPLMPNGAEVTRAYLSAIPGDINDGEGDVYRARLQTSVQAHAISNAGWLDGTSADPAYDPTPLPQTDNDPMRFSRGDKTHHPTTWDITAQAQGWLPRPFVTNNGILLRLAEENCSLGNLSLEQVMDDCGLFSFEDQQGWDEEWLARIYDNAEPQLDPLYSSEHGGLWLLVFYNAPQIEPGDTYDVNAPGFGTPPGSRDAYFRANHTYRVENAQASRWYALTARSFGRAVTTPLEQNRQRVEVPLEGSIGLRMSLPAAGENAPLPISTSPVSGSVSYILLNGHMMDAASRQARWLETSTADPSARATGYKLQMLEEAGQLSTTAAIYDVETTSFSSGEGLRLYNLNLPPNSNTQVRLTITGDNTPAEDSSYRMGLRAEVVRSANAFVNPTSSGPALPVKREGQLNRGSSVTFTPGSANQALVITYQGPQVFTNELPPVPTGAEESVTASEAAAAVPQVLPPGVPPTLPELAFNLKIEVISCPAGSYPVSGDICQPIECPNLNDVNYRPIVNLGLWNAAGWSQQGADWVTVQSDPRNQPAPMLGGPNRAIPRVAVVGGILRYNTVNGVQSLYVAPNPAFPEANGDVYLIDCSQDPPRVFQVYSGAMRNDTRPGNLSVIEPNGAYVPVSDPWHEADRQDLDPATFDFHIRPAQGLAVGDIDLRRRLDAGKPTQRDLKFNVGWQLDIDGWLDFTHTVSAHPTNQAPPKMASLNVALGANFRMDQATLPANPDEFDRVTPRPFEALRAGNGRVTQPADLGGASKGLQVLILPRSVPIPSELPLACNGGSCMDLRAPDDTYEQPNRVWSMPDVHTTSEPGMVMLSRPGEMLVFSKDHPAASPAGFNQQYSFDAYKASVSVEQEQCIDNPQSQGYDPAAPIVSVVRGEARIALPNIGSASDPNAGITARFKLCEGTLRSVHLSFEAPVGLPIGTSGLFLTGLSGSVDIFPTNTVINVKIYFQTSPGGDGGILKAEGSVTIDTAGLFAFQGNGKVMGIANVDGTLHVAWNSLDILLDFNVRIGNWLEGGLYAHMWQGRGWDGRYTWLENNKALHAAGQIDATLTLREGSIIDIWELQLPPFDLSFGVELAFGEFCTNDNCTRYEWGIKGKLVIFGYDVGLYYGFEEGLDFILGNDDHILIDQFGGQYLSQAQRSALAAQGLRLQAAPQQIDGVATIPFAIGPQTENMLTGLGWLAGNPKLTLITPDGVEITPANAQSYGATFYDEPTSRWIGVANPLPGAWQAKIANLSVEGAERYTFMHLGNKGAPGAPAGPTLSAERLQVTPNGQGAYTISWSVPPEVNPEHTISLFHHRMDVISGTLQRRDLPIEKHLPYSQGSYSWTPRGMINGEYTIYAVVDDGQNELPVDQISIPDDACIPLHGPYPRVRAFDEERFPGTEIFTATTKVQINDTTAPAGPAAPVLSISEGAIKATWSAVADQDVDHYLVSWGPQVGNAFLELSSDLVSIQEGLEARIGTVNSGTAYGVNVRAIDVNGNTSPPSPAAFITPNEGATPVPLAPAKPVRLNGSSSAVSLNWSPAAGPAASEYRVTYTRRDVVPAEQGMLVVNSPSATLDGLTAGATYDIGVAAGVVGMNNIRWYSANSEPLRVVVSNGLDGNGDGLPDDWAGFHQVSVASTDYDGDGLSNGAEFSAGTHPLKQDSDGDNMSDAEELAQDSDPLRSDVFGSEFLQPRLALEEDTLTFRIRPNDTSLAAAPSRNIAYSNVGGGSLQLQASSDYPWLTAGVVGGSLQIGLNTGSMAPGFYSGVVRLNQAGSDKLIGEPQCVRVKAWIYPGTGNGSPNDGRIIYIPMIQR